jgi:hypothetical protein
VKIVPLACCDFLLDVKALKEFVLTHGLDGVDWSFSQEDLTSSPAADGQAAGEPGTEDATGEGRKLVY